MNLLRRVLIAAAIGLPLLVAGCAATAPAVDPAVARVLAPTGTLRVGVYPGSPTSLVVNPKTGERAGVAMELGQALGSRLGVPVQVVEFGQQQAEVSVGGAVRVCAGDAGRQVVSLVDHEQRFRHDEPSRWVVLCGRSTGTTVPHWSRALSTCTSLRNTVSRNGRREAAVISWSLVAGAPWAIEFAFGTTTHRGTVA